MFVGPRPRPRNRVRGRSRLVPPSFSVGDGQNVARRVGGARNDSVPLIFVNVVPSQGRLSGRPSAFLHVVVIVVGVLLDNAGFPLENSWLG